ncbi:MAG: hypothetical protein R3F20_06300 [Planctomycetota bacterium]
MDRREFNLALAGLPLLFGAWKLQDEAAPTGKRPAASTTLAQARARMKALNLPGLVIVLPTDEKERLALGEALLRLLEATPEVSEAGLDDGAWQLRLNRERRESVALASSCVIVCLEAEEARRELESTAPRMVIDEKGTVLRRLDAVPRRVTLGFAPRLVDLVHGARLEHLRARVAALRPPRDGRMDVKRQSSLEALARDFRDPKAAPADPDETAADPAAERDLVKWLDEDPRRAAWASLVLLETTIDRPVFLASCRLERAMTPRIGPSKTMPFGAVMPRFVEVGCLGHVEQVGDEVPLQDISIDCGMPSLSDVGGRYLRFAADGKKK